jgi:hypothetical protein
MRGMDLDAGEAGLLAKPRRIDEARHHLVDILLGHRFQRRKHFRMLAEVKRHGRWRPGFLQLVTPPSTSRATLNRSAWLLSLFISALRWSAGRQPPSVHPDKER